MTESNDKSDSGQVVEKLLGKSWEELEVLEHVGYLLFPDILHKRKKNGTFEEIEVALRVPRQHELRKARVQAREIALRDGLDLDRDKDLLDDIETVCVLAMSIRNRMPPQHEPMIPDPEDLEKNYDRACLMRIWARLDSLNRLMDPAPDSISEEEMFALIAAIAKERSISPLAVYAVDSQATCIITMASMLISFLAYKSSSEPSDSSTQE